MRQVTGLTLSGPWLGVWAAHSRCDWSSIGSLKTNVSDFFEIKKYCIKMYLKMPYWNGRHLFLSQTLRWRHIERDSVSSHQPHDCLLNGLFRRRSKKTTKLRVTGLCVGNSPGPCPGIAMIKGPVVCGMMLTVVFEKMKINCKLRYVDKININCKLRHDAVIKWKHFPRY